MTRGDDKSTVGVLLIPSVEAVRGIRDVAAESASKIQ